jgi:hypothetical protein
MESKALALDENKPNPQPPSKTEALDDMESKALALDEKKSNPQPPSKTETLD